MQDRGWRPPRPWWRLTAGPAARRRGHVPSPGCRRSEFPAVATQVGLLVSAPSFPFLLLTRCCDLGRVRLHLPAPASWGRGTELTCSFAARRGKVLLLPMHRGAAVQQSRGLGTYAGSCPSLGEQSSLLWQ